jgi:uncharacterized Tic20 family protein
VCVGTFPGTFAEHNTSGAYCLTLGHACVNIQLCSRYFVSCLHPVTFYNYHYVHSRLLHFGGSAVLTFQISYHFCSI